MTTPSEPIVGIDLGTTMSVVAHLDGDGKPRTVPNDEGELTTPSVVFFDRSTVVVGREAVKGAELEPLRAATFAKRDVGKTRFHKKIMGREFPPEVMQALILRKLKHDAELKLGTITKAVVTVPAYFNEPRRKATQDAGRMAGIEVIDIINDTFESRQFLSAFCSVTLFVMRSIAVSLLVLLVLAFQSLAV